MNIRRVNRNCLCCGGIMPCDAEKLKENGHIEYICPKCGHNLLWGVVATDGTPEPGRLRMPSDEFTLGIAESVDWNTWEVWWTGTESMTRINGVRVSGEEKFEEYVDDMVKRHGA